METIIVVGILVGAIYSLIRMFKKQAGGDSGCGCQGKCSQCPSGHSDDSCQ